MALPANNQALRKFQWGAEAVKAAGTLHLATKPTANDTVTIGVTVYTFKASAVSPGDVAIGAAVTNSQTNLVNAVAGSDGINTPNPSAALAAFSTNNAVASARIPGTSGNTIVTTSSLVAGAPDGWDAATLGTTTAGSMARGVAVPATSVVPVEDIDFEPTDTVTRPQLAKGILVRNRGNETITARGTKFTIPDGPLDYEVLPTILSMGIASPVAPVAGVWTFARSLTADPAPISRSIERRSSDGSNNIDYRWLYCLLDSLSFKFAQDKEAVFGATGFGRRVQTNALTAAQVMPSVEIPVTGLLKVFIDSTWANLGVTQVSSQVYGADVKIMTGLAPFATMDGRTDLDFTTHILDASKIQIATNILMLVSNAGQFAAEKTAAEAQTLRAVRLQLDGTSSRRIQIDMMLKHTVASVFKLGTFQGQDIVQLAMEESNDGSNLLSIKVTNAINNID